jgi:hypothetical protein
VGDGEMSLGEKSETEGEGEKKAVATLAHIVHSCDGVGHRVRGRAQGVPREVVVCRLRGHIITMATSARAFGLGKLNPLKKMEHIYSGA